MSSSVNKDFTKLHEMFRAIDSLELKGKECLDEATKLRNNITAYLENRTVIKDNGGIINNTFNTKAFRMSVGRHRLVKFLLSMQSETASYRDFYNYFSDKSKHDVKLLIINATNSKLLTRVSPGVYSLNRAA